ncbi:MAG: CHAD domain-containing protein [Tepidimonas sp.]|uniref:CYTH and CHAD domain-containing protein n=1 Tax=Tepidimonas sp. TaxID=2002775 RepID=UPI00259FB7AD|nr:CHAD domain-containing protein [Tepidimonas sp.]MDM7456983.1 CHAD domain-containing protein [Tepidimonas sp.]
MPQEIELKFALPGLRADDALQRLRHHPLLRPCPIQQQRLVNRYYDTPDGWLRTQRCALRLRGIEVLAGKTPPGGQPTTGSPARRMWEQTLKTAGHGNGALSVRGEWTMPLARPVLDRAALRNTALAAAPDLAQRLDALQPVHETRCLRTTWTVQGDDGSIIEVALDTGDIHTQGRRAPLLELELELLAGNPAALYALAGALASDLPLLPARTSKVEQAQRLGDGTLDQPVFARPLDLPRHADPMAVARAALGDALGQLCDNLLLAARLDDPQAVHQARVGWRRWRSLLRLLRPWLPAPPAHDALRPLLASLGTVRDLDVARTETLPVWGPLFVESDSAHPDRLRAWQQATRRLTSSVRSARQALRAQLSNPASVQALLACATWLQQLPEHVEASDGWAAERLDRWHARLTRRLRESARPAEGQSTTDALHAVRLLAKRLRYGAEAVAPTLPGKAARRIQRWQRDARTWQSRIGRWRDIQRAAELLAEHHADAELIGFLRGAALASRQAEAHCSD